MISKVIHGDVIRTLREDAGLDRRDLAYLVGCSADQIRRAEREARPYVSAKLIRRIASALSEQLGRPVIADDLASDPTPCPTCGSPLALTA